MNAEALQLLLKDFFDKADYLDEIISAARFETDQECFDYFDGLSDGFESAPPGSRLYKKVESALAEFLEFIDFHWLVDFTKRVDNGSRSEMLLNEEFKKRLEKLDDILEIENYATKALFGSSAEQIFLARQLELLEKNSEALDDISSLDDPVDLPAWFIRMLRFPDLVPISLRLEFIRQAKAMYRLVRKMPPVGLFAEDQDSDR